MKRDVRLRTLSRDHHHALVLARFISTICDRGGMDAEAVGLVRERFAAEIAPHFLLEETLLAELEGLGVDALVKRTRDEHAMLLQLLEAACGRDTACMCDLGTLLEEHVRFEERELYPACEMMLSGDALDRIAAAYASAAVA